MVKNVALKCPNCKCTPHRGFDMIERLDGGDNLILNLYECPNCGKMYTRKYEFVEMYEVIYSSDGGVVKRATEM